MGDRINRWALRVVAGIPALAIAFLLSAAGDASAKVANHLYRVDIKPKSGYTRVTVRLDEAPDYTLERLPGNRVRLVFNNTRGPLFRKYRQYSDRNMGGLVFSRRADAMMVTFQIASSAGVRDVTQEGISAVTLDVGQPFAHQAPQPALRGREKIWSGVEKLVRDFDPPLKTEIPFQPTDPQVLKGILDANDLQSFSVAESALYKGRLSEAEEIFAQFAGRQTAIKALALYRLGETWYKLQKYPQALGAFREAERLWPAYLNFNSGATFYYGDSIARSGNLAAGRVLLARLIARLADKNYAPALLVRLADILVRQGHEQEALGIYRTVADDFTQSKAGVMARLRLADREFLRVNSWNYRPLADTYLAISRASSDIDLREEAQFKYVLLLSMHADAPQALQQVVLLQKRFPRGVYGTVCRTMREVLVALSYREAVWIKNAEGLIRFAEEHHDYLAGCLEQADFLPSVVKAYEEAGRPIELVKLLSTLLDHPWAAASGPYLHEQIAESADVLGDGELARKTLRVFLRKYPGHPRSKYVQERLGGLYFSAGMNAEARDALFWLLDKGQHANKAESYYYLGRAALALKQYGPAQKAIDLYVASARPTSGDAGIQVDAYAVGVASRVATGDRKGALRLLEAALKLPNQSRSDEFLYKAGELSALEGKPQQARAYFAQLIKAGKDADWQKLARQAVEDLDQKSVSPASPAAKPK